MAAGSYEAIMIYDTAGYFASLPTQGDVNNGPWVGDWYSFYGGASGGCAPPASNNINISGATVLNLSFGDVCQWTGAYGNLNYTGSKGTVSNCRNLYVAGYTTSSYDNGPSDNSQQFQSNNGRYDVVYNGGGPTLYLQAWYDVNGNSYGTCANGNPCPHTGDPVTQLGSYDGTTLHNYNITFDDSHLHP
jgi:hypothetical protein